MRSIAFARGSIATLFALTASSVAASRSSRQRGTSPASTRYPAPPDDIAERIDASIVHMFMPGDSEQPFYVGTGTLLRVGGFELVATAAHNLVDDSTKSFCDLNAITICRLPSNLVLPLTIGKGATPSIARRHVPGPPNADGDIWPDVAVLELTKDAILRTARQPFEEDELSTFDSIEQRVAWIGGFPVACAEGEMPAYGFTPRLVLVVTIPGARHSQEPPGGRGIHVRYGGTGYNHTRQLDEPIPRPHGISGGPLAVGGNLGRVHLVGLAARYNERAEDEWCEPVVEAVRLLVDHENVEIREGARCVLARLEPSSA